MRGVFITATGTDVGKTELACALLAALRGAGREVHPRKPVLSGYRSSEHATSDAGRLMRAAGLGLERLDDVAPHRFAAPLAPGPAAAREGRSFDAERFVLASRAPGFAVVEGVGGLMVPLDAQHTVLDVVPKLGLPVLLVAGTYLGTLSHTLTAWAALRTRWGGAARVVLSESSDGAMSLEETAADLEPHLGHAPWLFPRLEAARPPLLNWLEELSSTPR